MHVPTFKYNDFNFITLGISSHGFFFAWGREALVSHLSALLFLTSCAPFTGISRTLFSSYIRCALAICRLEDINLVMVMRRYCHYYFVDEIFMVSVPDTRIDQLGGLICRFSYVDEWGRIAQVSFEVNVM